MADEKYVFTGKIPSTVNDTVAKFRDEISDSPVTSEIEECFVVAVSEIEKAMLETARSVKYDRISMTGLTRARNSLLTVRKASLTLRVKIMEIMKREEMRRKS